MKDAQLAAVLHGLGIDHDTRGALSLLPLVQVAWADGSVHQDERDLILQVAAERDLAHDEGLRLLESWLRFPPSERYLARGRMALVELARRNHDSLPPGGLDDIVTLCEQVARAAGGLFLGFGSVEASERSVLAELAEALDIDVQQDWRDVFADLDARPPQLEELDVDLPDEVTDVGPMVVGGTGPDDLVDVQADTLTEDDPAPLTGARLVGRSADGEQEELHALTDPPVTIGRRQDNDIRVRWDGQASRQHCLIRRQGARWYVVDSGSVNGTRVDGELILERRLLGGEIIAIGSTELRFELC